VWLRAGLCQVAGIGLVLLGLFAWMRTAGTAPPPLAAALAAGVIAAGIGYRIMRLPPWWLVIHVAFPPALLLAAGTDIEGWVFGILFVLSVLVFWNTLRDRVPLYLTNATAAAAVADLADALEKNQDAATPRFVDLGSGPGGFALRVADRLADWQVVGIESSPVLYGLAVLRCWLAGTANLRFQRASIWQTDLAGFDAVYAFLSPAPMERLYAKARAEMRPGSLFISNTFAVPGQEPDEIVEVADRRRSRLLIWRL